ncbi:hypothetical protein D9619_012131 [Psilocybe cf. subviscida]|uniref:Uncharacterized protein n=1 Tax=Psilocybe cf. subviscida TaxID=2480587 RepID=A0A8H5B7G7_9AGAR|nr:hypothetical protein D9619_012131 [Psilocybe cf. subviscida]
MGDTVRHSNVIQAKKVVIVGGKFSQTINQVGNQTGCTFEEETKKLHNFVSHDAFHDSYKYAYPRHHVLTPAEQDIISTATNWAYSKKLSREDRVLHLDLSASAAGQYVAQHIAELFEQQKCLRGTFFFRFPEHATRPERFFVATLAHQLGISLPHTKEDILGTIRSDPYLLTRHPRTQMQRFLSPFDELALRKRPTSSSSLSFLNSWTRVPFRRLLMPSMEQ